MVFNVFFLVVFACAFISTVTASCGCACSNALMAQPYIVELTNTEDCSRPGGFSSSQCFDINCAKCGRSLECYVNTGNAGDDAAVCAIVNDETKFCPLQRVSMKFTPCGQQCSGTDGVSCFPGEDWGTCPAVLGSFDGSTKCKFGANGGPAALSNFASYTVCTGASGASCAASGVCSPDGSSYQCTVDSGCVANEAVICLNDKCDTDLSSDGTCPCA